MDTNVLALLKDTIFSILIRFISNEGVGVIGCSGFKAVLPFSFWKRVKILQKKKAAKKLFNSNFENLESALGII